MSEEAKADTLPAWWMQTYLLSNSAKAHMRQTVGKQALIHSWVISLSSGSVNGSVSYPVSEMK